MKRYAVLVGVETISELSDAELDRLQTTVEQQADATVSRRAASPGYDVLVHLVGDDAGRAARDAAAAVSRWSEHAADQQIVEIHARTEAQHEVDGLAPDFPLLAGAADAAALLGISRQRVHQLAAEHPAFPAPLARIAAGPVWTVPALEHFAAGWRRRPGRPAAS
ncbi:MAG: hypothetical protein ACR2GH_14420 [Pseudonocardia sp.]